MIDDEPRDDSTLLHLNRPDVTIVDRALIGPATLALGDRLIMDDELQQRSEDIVRAEHELQVARRAWLDRVREVGGDLIDRVLDELG